MTKTKTAKYRNERLEVLHKTAAGGASSPAGRDCEEPRSLNEACRPRI